MSTHRLRRRGRPSPHSRGEHEFDLIVDRDDGRIVAIEVKLTAVPNADDVRHLHWLKRRLGEDVLDMVVINTGAYAYPREDGIAVVPAALLGPSLVLVDYRRCCSPVPSPRRTSSAFASDSLREPLSRILDKPYRTSVFARHLERLPGESRGTILQRSGGAGAPRYRSVEIATKTRRLPGSRPAVNRSAVMRRLHKRLHTGRTSRVRASRPEREVADLRALLQAL